MSPKASTTSCPDDSVDQQHKVSPVSCLGVYDDNSRVSLMSWRQYPKQSHTSCMQWHYTVSPVPCCVTTAVAWRAVTWLQSSTSQQWRSRNSTGCQSHNHATCLITPSPPDTNTPAPCTGRSHVWDPHENLLGRLTSSQKHPEIWETLQTQRTKPPSGHDRNHRPRWDVQLWRQSHGHLTGTPYPPPRSDNRITVPPCDIHTRYLRSVTLLRLVPFTGDTVTCCAVVTSMCHTQLTQAANTGPQTGGKTSIKKRVTLCSLTKTDSLYQRQQINPDCDGKSYNMWVTHDKMSTTVTIVTTKIHTAIEP